MGSLLSIEIIPLRISSDVSELIAFEKRKYNHPIFFSYSGKVFIFYLLKKRLFYFVVMHKLKNSKKVIINDSHQ